MYIGERVKKLRKEIDMTLVELSEKSGVAVASLSRIENNKMTGTLESHIAISNALGINISDLYQGLAADKKAPVVQTSSDRTDVFVHDNKSVSEMLTSKVLEKKMMPVLIKVEPKGATHKEETKRGIEKFIYVISGKVEAVVGDNTYALNESDTLYFDSSSPHYFKNVGTGEARIVCVISPPVL